MTYGEFQVSQVQGHITILLCVCAILLCVFNQSAVFWRRLSTVKIKGIQKP